ncbi:MAG TPA: hypothetical protein VFW44_05715 [Bryobacteraceae bacterium]|nr:hypothetical protein [Bryobacteraceae bacterium]
MPRILTVSLLLVLPFVCVAAEDSSQQDNARPACGSHNQGQLWPEAANHDSKLMARLMRCGELFLCVRGTWRYHWESPSVRLDQLGRGAKAKSSKPSTCEEESTAQAAPPDAVASNVSR